MTRHRLTSDRERPRRRHRLLMACLVGIGCGLAYSMRAAPDGDDFAFTVRAARALLSGADPYAGHDVLLYPLPAVVASLPFTAIESPRLSSAVYVALSSALLAFATTQRGWWGLWMIVSPPFVLAVMFANWALVLACAALLPTSLGWLAAVKPNLGVVAVSYAPTKAALAGVLAINAIAFALLPRWPADWLAAVGRQTVPHTPALLWPIGAVGLLGFLRWRTPEGRLLGAMTLVPTSALPYDYLMLWLVPRTRGESVSLTCCGWLAFFVLVLTAPHDLVHGWTWGHAVVAGGTILPATVITLRHRNPDYFTVRGTLESDTPTES